jgi:type VI secretion system protein ImpC
MPKEQTEAATGAPQTLVQTAPEAGGDFDELVRKKDEIQKKFAAVTPAAATAIEVGVQKLCEIALTGAKVVPGDAVRTIEGIIAEIDRRLSAQVNQIIHAPEFRKLEGSWRGLHHLVNNTETDETLKIRVFNASKEELGRSLKKFKGVKFDQSPLFRKVYESEFGMLGGEPFGCLIGDYQFDHTAPDVDMLASIAEVSAAAHAPFFAAAAPSLMQMKSWQELGDKRDLTEIFKTAEYAPWRALREKEDSKYVGLTMPRYLARRPYSVKDNPVDDFAFEEDADGTDHEKYVWSNAAYAMGVNLNRSFKDYGWLARIRGVEAGGKVEGLPSHTFPTDDGGVDMKCPTEIAITDRREGELTKNGLIALTHRKNSTEAVFMGVPSLNRPPQFTDADATANAALGASMQYLFATCRFAHYLKCMVRDKVGSFKEREDMQTMLNEWIIQYVEPDPKNATEEAKAKKPLAKAEVTVEEVEGAPGYYTSKFWLRPHYQLEGLTVSLRLVSKLPSERGA